MDGKLDSKMESKSKFKTELINGKVLIKISWGVIYKEFAVKMYSKWDGNPNKKMRDCNLAILFHNCPKVAKTQIEKFARVLCF